MQVAGANASANTGNGGNGAFSNDQVGSAGGTGGSGIVIARYQGAAAATGGTIAAGSGTAAGYTVHSYGTAGSNSFNLSSVDMNARLGTVITSGISGSGDLSFSGPGKLTLNAANTYTGATRINAGTLILGSSGSISTSSEVILATDSILNVAGHAAGYTFGNNQTLSGGGTVVGNTTISGTHSPGFSPGIQTFSGDLEYAVGSTVVWELIDNTIADRGTKYDGVNVSGDLTFAGSTTISLDFALLGSMVNWTNEFWDFDRTGTDGWKVFDVAGEISGFENLVLGGSTMDLTNGSLTGVRSGASFFLFEGEDGIYLNYSAVPEPSAALLGGLGMLALLRRRR